MELQFEWQKPVRLTLHKKIIEPNNEIDEIEDRPGLYYFARNFGRKSFPFYVGETMTLRSRLKQHLATVKICDILRGMEVSGAPAISGGPRSFHYAYFRPKKGQTAKTKTCLAIAQRVVIREAIAQNIPIINLKLTVIKTHILTFDGKGEYRGIFLEEEMSASTT